MKIKKKDGLRIKLQLDYKTIVVVTKESSLKMWMKKFPGAVILNSSL